MVLDSKEVELKGRALAKSASGSDPSTTVLSLLDELRRGVVASEELLRSTKIGVTVNKLKQHKDPAVARQAGELVSKWRSDVKKGHLASSAGTPSSAATGASTPRSSAAAAAAAAAAVAAANGTASPSAALSSSPASGPPAKAVKPKHNVAPEKRNSKEDKVNINVTGNSTRDSCLKLMYDGLAYMSEEVPDEVLRVAREVELAAFNAYQPETSTAYKSRMRMLFQNLKNRSNGQLRMRVLMGEIAASRFVAMNHDELKSAERRAEDAKLMKENMDKAMVAQEEKSVSTQLQCGKCGQRKVSYTQAQTRSADEPMTTFCECLNCGNRWKFS